MHKYYTHVLYYTSNPAKVNCQVNSVKKKKRLQENNNIMKVVSCTASELITYDF